MAVVFSSAAISFLFLFISISSPFVSGAMPPPAVDCSNVVLNMAGCLSFVMLGSRVEKPEGSCCSGLKKVLDVNPECLCEGLKNSGSFGVKLNITKASTLPEACKLNAPPMSACGLVSTDHPASAPAPVHAANSSAPASTRAPNPSQKNHGSSLIAISGLSFVISGVLVILFSCF